MARVEVGVLWTGLLSGLADAPADEGSVPDPAVAMAAATVSECCCNFRRDFFFNRRDFFNPLGRCGILYEGESSPRPCLTWAVTDLNRR